MSVLRTVTLNSGFDDTFTVSGLEWGGVGRVRGFRSVPSGKGVNAARAAAALGVPVCAYSLVGRDDAATFAAALQSEGIEHRLVAVPGSTRHNLTLVPGSADRVAAHLVAQGFQLRDAQPVAALADRLLGECRPGDVVSCNGSVPGGVPATVWADLVAALRDADVAVVLDVQGEAMLRALAAGPVALAKPNESEIAALPGVESDGPDPVAEALQSLAGSGVAHPVVTLGSAGAAFLRDGRVHRAACPVERPVVAVGAGDAFLAGVCAAILAGRGEAADLVSAGLAAAAAHVAGLTGDGLRAGYEQHLRRVRIEAD
jgi:1-phosphofructokinase